MSEPLAFRAAIPATGNPITFSGGEGECGGLKLEHYMSGEEIEQLLELRGKELIVTIQET